MKSRGRARRGIAFALISLVFVYGMTPGDAQSPAGHYSGTGVFRVAQIHWKHSGPRSSHDFLVTALGGAHIGASVPSLNPPNVTTSSHLHVSHRRCSMRGDGGCIVRGEIYEIAPTDFEFDPLLRTARIEFEHHGTKRFVEWTESGEVAVFPSASVRRRERLDAGNLWWVWRIEGGVPVERPARARADIPGIRVPKGAQAWMAHFVGTVQYNSACFLDQGEVCS